MKCSSAHFQTAKSTYTWCPPEYLYGVSKLGLFAERLESWVELKERVSSLPVYGEYIGLNRGDKSGLK